VTRSEEQALQLFQKAASQNLPVAQRQLGSICESGRGVNQDMVEAWRWYSQAAAKGDPQAAQSQNALSQRLTPDQIKEAEFRAKPAPGDIH
jgi:TPR repeat protein